VGGEAAVHLQAGAVHVAGVVGGEERDRGGDLVGAADAPSGITRAYSATMRSLETSTAASGVSMGPGQTALVRMPSLPWSMARVRV